MNNYNGIEEFFYTCNHENYLVLRNYENYPEVILSREHEDIDILCEDKKSFVEKIDAEPLYKKNDGVHYYILINDKQVPIDIRDIEDGYYYRKWAIDMLETKRLYKELFYVMDDSNYFYSLLYHAVVHKSFISDEYIDRLRIMASRLGITITDRDSCYSCISSFLRTNEFFITNSSDVNLHINNRRLDKKLLKIDYNWLIRQIIYDYIRKIKSNIKKHLL